MKKIKLSNGGVCLVSDEDFDYLNHWKWRTNHNGYAVRTTYKEGRRVQLKMHQDVIYNRCKKDRKVGFVVDHINRNRLDNQRLNLRLVTFAQNSQNREYPFNASSRLHSSIYKGVGWHKNVGIWCAYITKNKKFIYIGLFKQERHAALAYDLWAKELHGEKAILNFN